MINKLLPAVTLATYSIALPTQSEHSGGSILQWKPCNISFNTISSLGQEPPFPYECASLAVPLDYTNTEASETLDLDLVRVKALNEPSRSTVLFNPGGPGGSGLEFVVMYSDILHTALDGNHDLIGFDPRGVGRTVPFDCDFGEIGSIGNRNFSTTNTNSFLYKQSIDEAIDTALEDYQPAILSCVNQTNAIADLIGTAFVARDMARIADALSEDGMLHYWGISYGTVLGAIFAAMFPDRVGSMLLDSNVNLAQWREGTQLEKHKDTDKAFLAFLDECVASPDRCGIAEFAPSGSGGELVDAYNNVAKLEASGELGGSGQAELLKVLTLSVLYSPETWAFMTQHYILTSLFGSANSLSANSSSPSGGGDSSSTLDNNLTRRSLVELASLLPTAAREYNNSAAAAYFGIMCGDTTWRIDSEADLRPIASQQWNTSVFADVSFPDSSWVCAQWPTHAKEIYSDVWDNIETANPILLVNGLYDPVTPFVSAQNTSAVFNGSVLLTHKGYGHGSTSHPSLCTARAIRAYFNNGTLPAEDTECEPDERAFDLEFDLGSLVPETSPSRSRRRSAVDDMSVDDAALYNAMRQLGRKLPAPRMPGAPLSGML